MTEEGNRLDLLKRGFVRSEAKADLIHDDPIGRLQGHIEKREIFPERGFKGQVGFGDGPEGFLFEDQRPGRVGARPEASIEASGFKFGEALKFFTEAKDSP